MRKEDMTDEQIEMEIQRLSNSEEVQIARREQRIKYKRRQYLYQLEKNTICCKAACQWQCRHTMHREFAQLDKHGNPIQVDIFKEGAGHESRRKDSIVFGTGQ